MSPVASTRRGREPQLRKNIARPQLSLPLSAGQDCLRLAPQSAQVCSWYLCFRTGEADQLVHLVWIHRGQSLGKLSCRQTTQHGLQILAEIIVALQQAVARSVVDPAGFHANTLGWRTLSCNGAEQHLDLAFKALVLHRGWSQRSRFLRRALHGNLEHGRTV